MAQVRYLSPKPNYRRIFRAEDLAGLGVDHPDTIVFEKSNNWTLEMNDGACDALVSKLPEEFVVLGSPTIEHVVTEETGSFSDDQVIDESGADDPQESPDDSLSDAEVMTAKSPRAKRPRD
jgi:hypothetical protein